MYHLHIALHSFLATSWATARKPWIDTSGATTTLSTTSCFPRAGRTRALCWPGGQEDKWCDHTPDVAMTAQKPDLVIVNRKANPPEVTLVELTVPWNREIKWPQDHRGWTGTMLEWSSLHCWAIFLRFFSGVPHTPMFVAYGPMAIWPKWPKNYFWEFSIVIPY